jgi:hypothetical protein
VTGAEDGKFFLVGFLAFEGDLVVGRPVTRGVDSSSWAGGDLRLLLEPGVVGGDDGRDEARGGVEAREVEEEEGSEAMMRWVPSLRDESTRATCCAASMVSETVEAANMTRISRDF